MKHILTPTWFCTYNLIHCIYIVSNCMYVYVCVQAKTTKDREKWRNGKLFYCQYNLDYMQFIIWSSFLFPFALFYSVFFHQYNLRQHHINNKLTSPIDICIDGSMSSTIQPPIYYQYSIMLAQNVAWERSKGYDLTVDMPTSFVRNWAQPFWQIWQAWRRN